jgi:hypothetical protein
MEEKGEVEIGELADFGDSEYAVAEPAEGVIRSRYSESV